jgi:hypothetical protein
MLGTLLLALLPGLAGWAWARRANRFGSGRVVVHESASLVVCDEQRGASVLRILLFKSEPTLRQSEVTIGASGNVMLGAKTPLHSHVNRAISLGLTLLPLERVRLCPRCASLRLMRCVRTDLQRACRSDACSSSPHAEQTATLWP